MKTLAIRAISALVAILILFVVYWQFNAPGIKAAASVAVVIGIAELSRLLSTDKASRKGFFYISIPTILVFSACLSSLQFGSLALILVWLVTAGASLILFQSKGLEGIQKKIVSMSLALIYGGLLPSFSVRLLDLPKGLAWFMALLAVVFAGDIFAYIFGSLFGKHKLMPILSPKKSAQGAVGGIFGSILAGVILNHLYQLFPNQIAFVFICTFAGILAQLGDFFESMLKRVADVKDSGHIMPGHGGALDRIDGVLFAGPVFFFAALYVSNWI